LLTGTAATRRGLLIRQAFISGHWIMSDNFTLKNPTLHPTNSIGGFGFRKTVINVGTQGMQWNTTLAATVVHYTTVLS
jgi:hypothetical protein